MANLHRNYNKKECVYEASTYLLRAQLLMSSPNAMVAHGSSSQPHKAVLCEEMLFRSETLAPVTSRADRPDKP
jgi:hypothetical protein